MMNPLSKVSACVLALDLFLHVKGCAIDVEC